MPPNAPNVPPPASASLALIRAAEYEDAIRRFKLDGVSIRSICRAITRREGRDEEHGLIRLISLGIMREAQESEREKGGKCSARALHYVTVTLHWSVVVA